MGDRGKRFRSQRRDKDGDDKYQKRRISNKEASGDGELVVYRILCPDGFIGSVIGKSGKVINSIRQESNARVKVLDSFPGTNDRVITIYCYVKDRDEEVDEDDMRPLCPAQDALLKVHAAIMNAVATIDESDNKGKEDAHILVPSSQVANIIGKSGSVIKKLRSKTRAMIKVTPKDPNDPSHSCAMSFDNFIRISGDAGAVKKALFEVSAIMYKFSPKEEISLDSAPMELPPMELPPAIIIPSDAPIYSNGGFYPGMEAIVPPPRSGPPVMGVTSHVPELYGYIDTANSWPAYSSAAPVSGYGGPARDGELIIRVLCPSDKLGRVIGKGGSSIKNVRQVTGAHVEVDDPKRDYDECVISVTSTESSDDIKSTAVEAVLLLQEKINDNGEDDSVNMRILVPSKVIGCLIGKSGAIVNEMRKRTKADVRISKSEKPKCAMDDEELVEVIGEVQSVRDALFQIVLRLRDGALRDREDGDRAPPPPPPMEPSLYPGSGGHSVPSTFLPSVAPLGYDQRMERPPSGMGMLSSSSLYGYGSSPVESAYGSVPSYLSKQYGGLQESSSEMVIPGNAVGKVMGKGGSNIGNIRKISGAAVEILESKSSRSDRIALISGTPEQKRAAENLIQAFILAA